MFGSGTGPGLGLEDVVDRLEEIVSGLDVDALSGSDACRVVSLFEKAERICHGGKTMCFGRVESTSSYIDEGFRDMASWVASRSGVTKSDAQGQLVAAKALDELPELRAAVTTGFLSPVQVTHVARSATASSVSSLIETATTEAVAVLAERSRRVSRSVEIDSDARQRAERTCRIKTRPDGTVSIWAVLTAMEGARLLARHKSETDKVFRAAQRSGRRESWDQYSADALMAIVDSAAGTPGSPEATVNIVVDHSAVLRGHREPGETCEIAGVGEVSVSEVRQMMGDAFFRILVTDGTDIKCVTSTKRTIPVALKRALMVRDQHCQVPGCVERLPLEFDHITEFHKTKETSLDNLVRICRWHHRLKTTKGFNLVGGPGNWMWRGPGQWHEDDSGRPVANDPRRDPMTASAEAEGRLALALDTG